MPELPEVEVTRRSLAGALTGARIEAITLGKPLRWPLGCEPQDLVGQQVLGLRRRGKYLLADTSGGLLLVHLGMSGSLRFGQGLPAAGVHDHFEMLTNQGTLRLHDPRRFGAVVYARGEQDPVASKLLGGLGMEPLSDEFSPSAFHAGLKKSRMPIKQLLLGGAAGGRCRQYLCFRSAFSGRCPPNDGCRAHRACAGAKAARGHSGGAGAGCGNGWEHFA